MANLAKLVALIRARGVVLGMLFCLPASSRGLEPSGVGSSNETRVQCWGLLKISCISGPAALCNTNHNSLEFQSPSLSQSVSQSVSQRLSQSVNHSVNESVSQSVSQSLNHSVSQSVSQSVN